jgi:hypothetical protein
MARVLPHSIHFFHRENWDSSLDSICGICYLTVGRAENEEDLQEQEQSHRCAGSKTISYRSLRSGGFRVLARP